MKIAIDGPAGAGKSTIAKHLAQILNFEYIDTGAMYRAITLKGLRLGVNLEDENAYDFLANTELDICNGKVFMDGVDVSQDIRSVEVTENVSTPSKIGAVRSFLVDYQRKISESKNVIMDGRDIGTVVLPNAELKIYLSASVECRAKRRMLERQESGVYISLEDTINEINIRDHKDSTRKISPLKCAEDAVVIDSSNMSINEVVDEIINLVNERSLSKMSEKYFEGQHVRGTIINVTSSAIYLVIEEGVKAVIYDNDLEGKRDGKLYNEYHEGEEFTAQVKQISQDQNDGSVLLILSEKLAREEAEREAKEEALLAKLKVFEDLKEKDEIFNAKVSKTFKNGVELTYNNTRLFLPYKFASVSEEAFKSLKGEEIEVLVLFVNEDRHQVIVSQIAAEKKKNRLAREAAFNAIHVGDVIEGEVVSILPYGAIVSLGEVSGLLHISEIDHFQVRNINKYLTVGQKVNVKVIKIDGKKIGLSIKALTKHPWEILKEQYHVGDVFEGTIKKIIPAGLIIALTPEYSGLMPKMEYSWLINDRYENKLNEGDTITVKVMNIDDQKNRVSLSHRETLENTWGSIKLKRGQAIDVTVASIVEKGAQVNYLNVTGFLPISEVSNTKRVNSVAEVYPVGTTFKASVIECDPLRAKLIVSAKALEAQKERETFDNYMKEQAKEDTTSTFGDLLKDFEEDK